MIEVTRPVVVARPPRSMAWVLLLAAAIAVLAIGAVATAAVFTRLVPESLVVPATFWVRLLVASGLTLSGLGLRTLRWIFLLRRAETRVPIRDAYIGYLSGLALLLAPLFLGEALVRAWVLRRRADVPTGLTALLTLWERWFDLLALVTIVGALALVTGTVGTAVTAAMLAVVGLFLTARPLRTWLLGVLTVAVNRAGRVIDARVVVAPPRLVQPRTCAATWVTSVLAWTLPAIGFWIMATGGRAVPLLDELFIYSWSTLLGGVSLAPGGVVVTGATLLERLALAGFSSEAAALTVLGGRLATAGVCTALGLLFVGLHWRSPQTTSVDHFDAIADAYDVQISEARRTALLGRKTTLMREWLERSGHGRRGMDVGCGQGWYVGQMRAWGFDVSGIDASPGQVTLAARHIGDPAQVRVGSLLQIPAADASVDFAYTINVLHHLPSLDSQRAAFVELFRVLRPGGSLIVHEINTTNVLFRFYMGYVFPSLNCIDEGVERWLLPSALSTYTDVPAVEVHYFTFFPDFMPQPLVRLCAPLERWLEQSSLRRYSAHYMAVLRKPA
jgi:ubiquinone/menaquinone biosynthesis C-methylase UbiE